MAATVLSSLSLFAATPEQILESRRRSAVEWGKDRSLEEYLALYEFTDRQEVARNGRLITWVLAPRNDPTSLSFLCSCETFRREGLICYEEADAKPKKVVCYGIASVFTPPSFRGKGYAGHMMRLLHWVIAEPSLLPAGFPSEWGAPPDRVAHAGDGIFSALWSDVGAEFYRRCGPTKHSDGWVVRSPFSTTWDVKQGKSNTDTTGWILLDEAGAMKLWEDDAENITRTFSSADNFKVSFAYLPRKDVVAFQYWRNIDILKKRGYTIQHLGVAKDSHTFATWTFEIKTKTLLITRLSSLSADFEHLLSIVMTVASQHGMDSIEVYNLPDHLQSSATRLGGMTIERNEHLPSFKWYEKEDATDVAWLLNESAESYPSMYAPALSSLTLFAATSRRRAVTHWAHILNSSALRSNLSVDALAPASLTLFAATPEQILESRRRASTYWGRGLSPEEYLAREEYINKQELARDGKLITWVLAPRGEPTSLDFLCSCKTFRRDGLVWPQIDAKPKKVVCYGIASLFTPPHFRGKGYASHAMRLLHWVLADGSLLPATFPAEWGTPPPRVTHAGDGLFSVLWSDVGPEIYKRCGPTKDSEGWVVRSPVSTIWDVKQISSSTRIDTIGLTFLDKSDVFNFWKEDAENIARTVLPADGFKISFSCLPNKGVAAYQYWRMIEHLKKYGYTTIQHWGVVKDSNTFATWTFEVMPSSKTLVITRLSSSFADFEHLLDIIMSVARKHGMERVEVYNLPKHLQSSAMHLGGITMEREEHLSSFRWYGKENSSEVAWLLNER